MHVLDFENIYKNCPICNSEFNDQKRYFPKLEIWKDCTSHFAYGSLNGIDIDFFRMEIGKYSIKFYDDEQYNSTFVIYEINSSILYAPIFVKAPIETFLLPIKSLNEKLDKLFLLK
jgi:hypothetical protein